MRVDINADIGESFGPYVLGHDESLLRSITSASIACGFHAGDPSVMRRTVRLAKQAGVAIGAHPGFPDLIGFGRREMNAAPDEIEDFVLYQIGALSAAATAEALKLQHIKPHGALYHMAARHQAIAEAIVRAILSSDSSLILVGPSGSEILSAGKRAGLQVAAEAFADRAYEADGSLVSRRTPGAVLHDAAQVVERSVRMVREGVVIARDGSTLRVQAETICVHGDTPGADVMAARLRAGLEGAGIRVASLSEGETGAAHA